MSKQITISMPEFITVGQYQDFGTLDHLTQTQKIIRIVSAITKHSETDVMKWNATSLFKVYKDLNNSINEIEPAFLPIFEWEGQTWGFQPIHKMSAGEYIDLETRLKDGITKLHEVLAILYRPIKEHKFDSFEWKLKYNYKYVIGKTENLFKYYTLEDYDVEKRTWREEQFKSLPINLALGAYNFFLFVGEKFSKDLRISFLEMYKKMTKKEREEVEQLLNTTDGSTPFITSLTKEESSTLQETKE